MSLILKYKKKITWIFLFTPIVTSKRFKHIQILAEKKTLYLKKKMFLVTTLLLHVTKWSVVTMKRKNVYQNIKCYLQWCKIITPFSWFCFVLFVLKWFPFVNLALINVARFFNKLARYQILCRELHVPVKTTGGKVMNGSRWIQIILIRQKRRWCDNSNSKTGEKEKWKTETIGGPLPASASYHILWRNYHFTATKVWEIITPMERLIIRNIPPCWLSGRRPIPMSSFNWHLIASESSAW